ncbi:Germin-like protein subfamily 1 member 18 [Linum grandiflorum]
MNRQVQNFLFIALALLSSRLILVSAVDSAPLQDFCVATRNHAFFVNGHVCKDPKKVTADDFFLTGLDKPGNTSNPVGSKVTLINVDRIPGLNTLGISLARDDYIPNGGLNPLHYHPRATELFLALEGTFYVGFLASNPDRLISKVLRPGDLFVFPVGRIHFQYNIGKTPGRAVSGLSSQNPGIVVIANSVFGSNPGVDPSLLAAAFRMDKELVEYLQKKF